MEKQMKIAAGIVLYEPDLERLLENVSTVAEQVDKIIIVDNASSNVDKVKTVLTELKNIYYIENKINQGIAKALNQIIDMSKKCNMDWVLTLDQDSIISENFIKHGLKYMHIEGVAIITPRIIDRNDFCKELLMSSEASYVDECITSGSLMNLKICNQVGKFDEKMFIDYVDFEYCYRVKGCGYKILYNPESVLLHQLGNGEVKKNFGKTFLVSHHNPIRHFFLVRNCIYCIRKHGLYQRMLYRIFRDIFEVIFYEKCKVKKLTAMANGIVSGFYM